MGSLKNAFRRCTNEMLSSQNALSGSSYGGLSSLSVRISVQFNLRSDRRYEEFAKSAATVQSHSMKTGRFYFREEWEHWGRNRSGFLTTCDAAYKFRLHLRGAP